MSNTILTSGTLTGQTFGFNQDITVQSAATIIDTTFGAFSLGDIFGNAINTTLDPSGSAEEFYVEAGGTSTAGLIEGTDYGTANEYVYGLDTNSTINSGGYLLTESAGAVAKNEVVNSGGEMENYGGLTTDILVNSGGLVINDSGTMSGLTVQSGGIGNNNDGTDLNDLINAGGYSADFGIDINPTVLGNEVVISESLPGAGAGILNGAIINGGTIEVESGATALGNVDLSGTMIFDMGAIDQAAISFGTNGTLEFKGIVDPPNDTVTINNNIATFDLNGTIITQTLIGSYTGETFDISPIMLSGTSSTEITMTEDTATCFVAGTGIATAAGDVAVEKLAIGDMVMTADGREVPIKWIGTHAHAGPFIKGKHLMLPVHFAAGSLGDGVPANDLSVSPGHAMCIDNVLIPAWRLINGVSVTQPQEVESVHYYHIELENHDVILAEGAPVESYFDEDNRNQFHNAHTHAELYPDSVDQPRGEMCLPRIEHGPLLEAIRQRIAARAGVTLPAEDLSAVPGPLRGHVDEEWKPCLLTGWAQDKNNPEAPVLLDVIVNGVVHHVLANSYRDDLHRKGYGTGTHGFQLPIDPSIQNPSIEVRRHSDQTALLFTERARKDWNGSPLEPTTPSAKSLHMTGPLAGFIDTTESGFIRGWAQDTQNPETAVCLDILVDNKRITRVIADHYRGDLKDAGLGSGHHAFEARLPSGLSGTVTVRRSVDKAALSFGDAARAYCASMAEPKTKLARHNAAVRQLRQPLLEQRAA